MEILVFLILGALVGYIATRVMNRNDGLLGSTAIGVVGAFIGAFLASLVGENRGVLELTLGSFIAALVGAIALAAALNYAQNKNGGRRELR